jgi:hypothetical protein
MREVVFETLQADQLDKLGRPLLSFAVIETLTLQTEHDVLEHGAPWHEAGILEYHAAIRPRTGYRLVINHDSSCRRFEQTIAQIDERSFAATAGADDAHELALIDLQINIVQR